MRQQIVLTLVFSWFIVDIQGMPSKGNPYLGNCDTNADCPEGSVCMLPGFGKASAKAQSKCYFCNCTEASQCTLEDKMMTCNCTGTGYTGLYCETSLPQPCAESDVCVDDVVELYSLTATNTPQILTSPDFGDEWYCDGWNISWTISAPVGKKIQITITEFITEFFFDSLLISEGDCFASSCTDIVSVSGNADPNYPCQEEFNFSYRPNTAALISVPYETVSNVMSIRFLTDSCCTTGPGWNLTFIYID